MGMTLMMKMTFVFAKAMTYNILVSRHLKYHLTMRARSYCLLFVIVHGTSLLPREKHEHGRLP